MCVCHCVSFYTNYLFFLLGLVMDGETLAEKILRADSDPSSVSSESPLPASHSLMLLWPLEPSTAGSRYGSRPWNVRDSVPAVLTGVLLVAYMTLNVVSPTWSLSSIPGFLLQGSLILLSQRQLTASDIILSRTRANCDHEITPSYSSS